MPKLMGTEVKSSSTRRVEMALIFSVRSKVPNTLVFGGPKRLTSHRLYEDDEEGIVA